MSENKHFERVIKAIEAQERFKAREIYAFGWSDIKNMFLGCISMYALKKQHKLEDFAEWAVNKHTELMLKNYERRHKNDQL